MLSLRMNESSVEGFPANNNFRITVSVLLFGYTIYGELCQWLISRSGLPFVSLRLSVG
jgi:hypothetical protein